MLDAFIGEANEWEEVTKAWIHLDTNIAQQPGESIETTQVSTKRRVIANATWTPTLASVDSACRLRCGERIFEIDQVVNAGEQNRLLQFQLVERI